VLFVRIDGSHNLVRNELSAGSINATSRSGHLLFQFQILKMIQSKHEEAERTQNGTIDTLRAIAIVCVLAHHLFAYGGYQIPYLDRNGGLIGVQLFFIISGYLIIQSALKYPLRVFAVHRFFRIFPPYLVALLVFAFAKYFTSEGYRGVMDARWPYFLLNLANLQILHPISLFLLDSIHVGWSLTIELFWYLLAPFLVFFIGKDTKNRRGWIFALVLFAVVSTVWVYFASRGLLNSYYEESFRLAGVSVDNATFRHGLLDNALPAQLVYFMMGACLFLFQRDLVRIPAPILWIVSSSILLFVPLWNQTLGLFPNVLTGVGVAAFFLWIQRFGIYDTLTTWIAKVSYSVYLIHVPILLITFNLLKLSGYVGLAVAITSIVVLSEISWRLVEAPSQKLGKRLASKLRSGI
jgi:peptidoglycan/LPS O-acetylase OafA/YrhL